MIISSQRFTDNDKVKEKVIELSGKKELVLQAFEVGDLDGQVNLFVLADGHHRLEAANLLGIPVRFEITTHPEGLTGQELLNDMWMDEDYFDIETGRSVW